MKQYIVFLLFVLLLPAFSFGQEEEEDFDAYLAKFKSTEKEQYYHSDDDKEWKYVPYKPLNKSKVRRYKNEFFKFKKIKDYVPYDERRLSWNLFSHEPQYIGKIERGSIIKHEKREDVDAFVYWKGEPGNGLGIWVAYSINKGVNWSYYYTGITQNKPLFVKWYSNYPLFDSDGNLQIEACLMRKISDGLYYPQYEVVQDGLLLTFDLATLQRDSDGDGLTDILEKKYFTDPNNVDTDGDGVLDNLDLNPRRAEPRTDKTIVYEAIVNSDKRLEWCLWETDTCALIPLDEVTPVYYPTDSTMTVTVVSDDPNLISIQPANDRFIFLSSEEYDAIKTKNEYEDAFCEMDFYSPMFKTDHLENTYVFSIGGLMWNSLYYAKWTEKGWQIGGIMSITE